MVFFLNNQESFKDGTTLTKSLYLYLLYVKNYDSTLIHICMYFTIYKSSNVYVYACLYGTVTQQATNDYAVGTKLSSDIS